MTATPNVEVARRLFEEVISQGNNDLEILQQIGRLFSGDESAGKGGDL